MTYALPLDAVEEVEAPTLDSADSGAVAIEDDGFPFEEFCDVAELESWRKEVNRPLYYIHKWWARRLGTVFRAMVVGTFSPACSDVKDSFYRPVRFPQAVVFDPFMGSGTTIGEALKLGCRAIGATSIQWLILPLEMRWHGILGKR
jgi:adenine-specific DNA methylase